MFKELNWKNLDDSEIEREYSPSSVIGGNYFPFIEEYIRISNLVAGSFNVIECVYGPGSTNTLDLILPQNCSEKTPVPLVVFIHGGYWQELSKKESLFLGKQILDEGYAFAAIDYSLCPSVTLEEIVDECRMSISWLKSSGALYNFDPENIILTGSSAGAHLAAMCSIKYDGDSANHSYLPAATVLVSGIYELEPLIHTSVNDALKMNKDSALSLSPMFKGLGSFPKTLIAWGENETDEFKSQSRTFAKNLMDYGVCVETYEVSARNHFDVILDLAKKNTSLGNRFYKLLEDVCS